VSIGPPRTCRIIPPPLLDLTERSYFTIGSTFLSSVRGIIQGKTLLVLWSPILEHSFFLAFSTPSPPPSLLDLVPEMEGDLLVRFLATRKS